MVLRNDTWRGRRSFKDVMYDVTPEQWDAAEAQWEQQNAFWRDFWLGVMHDNGLSNREIARRCEVSPTTVAKHLKRLRP